MLNPLSDIKAGFFSLRVWETDNLRLEETYIKERLPEKKTNKELQKRNKTIIKKV